MMGNVRQIELSLMDNHFDERLSEFFNTIKEDIGVDVRVRVIATNDRMEDSLSVELRLNGGIEPVYDEGAYELDFRNGTYKFKGKDIRLTKGQAYYLYRFLILGEQLESRDTLYEIRRRNKDKDFLKEFIIAKAGK